MDCVWIWTGLQFRLWAIRDQFSPHRWCRQMYRFPKHSVVMSTMSWFVEALHWTLAIISNRFWRLHHGRPKFVLDWNAFPTNVHEVRCVLCSGQLCKSNNGMEHLGLPEYKHHVTIRLNLWKKNRPHFLITSCWLFYFFLCLIRMLIQLSVSSLYTYAHTGAELDNSQIFINCKYRVTRRICLYLFYPLKMLSFCDSVSYKVIST